MCHAGNVSGHWRDFTGQWKPLGSPLCPCDDDIQIVEELLASESELFGANARKRVWLFGIAPEFAASRPLQQVDLFALDRAKTGSGQDNLLVISSYATEFLPRRLAR
jgi:hypothetical protein